MQWMLMLFFFLWYDGDWRVPTTKQSDGEQCGSSVSRRGVEDKNRQVILDAHNALRSIVASGQESRGRPGPQPQASNMQIMVGWHTHTHTHGSHVVSNNLPLIIRACALLLWFALHAWLETCRQSLSYSLSLPLTSPFSLAQQNVCWLCSLNVIRHGTRNWQPSLNASPSSVYLNTTATNAAKWVSSRCELYSRASNAIFVQNINAKRSIVAVVLNLSPPFSGLFARGIYFIIFFFFLFGWVGESV